MILHLPWPPSVNHYWRNNRGITHISTEGKRYRSDVQTVCICAGRPRIEGRLSVTIQAYPPDRRRRDLDNTLKAMLDALKSAGVYEDDEQIDRIEITRCSRIDGGAVSVRLETIPSKEAVPCDLFPS